MRRFLTILCLLCLPHASLAETGGVILWIGDDEAQNLSLWRAEGFEVVQPACKPITAACVQEVINAKSAHAPVTLFVRGVYASLVHSLYAAGVTTDQVANIVMLRAEPAPLHDPYQVTQDAPPLTALIEKGDAENVIYANYRGVRQWRENGVPVNLLYLGPDGLSKTAMHRMTVDIIHTIMGNSPFNEDFQELLQAYGVWQTPPLEHSNFFELDEFITEKPVSKLLATLISFHYEKEPFYLAQWKLDTYKAFDLVAYRDAVAPGARYITLRNHRNQLIFLDMDIYAQYEPEIVIGLDDEDNLYRLTWFYRTKKMYSWKDDEQKTSARFMGPVLLFNTLLDDDLEPPFLLRSAMTLEGITFSNEDPLAKIKTYPEDIQTIVTAQNRCVNCHSFDGFDAYYFHTEALTGKPQGGLALPLVEYSEEVVTAFLYDQETSAAAIGMTPNPMPKDMADQFFAWWKALPRDEADDTAQTAH